MENVKEFKVYNSMTQQKEIFKPRVPGKASMYVCGVTSYDYSHLGHARAAVNFDILYRMNDPTRLILKQYQLAIELEKSQNHSSKLLELFKLHWKHDLGHSGNSELDYSLLSWSWVLYDPSQATFLKTVKYWENGKYLDLYLQHLGYEVTYVRNFTDVDDKIIKRANEIGEDPLKLSNRFCEEYIVDMNDLQCLLPTHQPRVSDHMEQIKDMISQIIKNGYAYEVDGDVFYSVDKCPNYGCLSGQKLEHNRAGERVAVDSRKRHPADFALWKSAKPGEPSWDSPWGLGRPGWHIECSAMSAHYLTFNFDIHGGGIDLIFPHHENEIAQSWAACQEGKISYWMHNGHVTNNNEKMSKSLGNFFTIRQISERYHPIALRHFLISAHYKSPLNYTVSQLESSSDAIYYIYQTLEDCESALSSFQEGGAEQNKKGPRVTDAAMNCIKKMQEEFEEKMSDDLQTPVVLTGAFQEALKFINSSLKMLKKKIQKKQLLELLESLTSVEKEVKLVLDVLGLLSPASYSEVLQQLKDKALKRAGLVEDDVRRMIDERTEARTNKDFAKSDKIRAELTVKGIALMDVGNETVWRPCIPSEQ